MPRWPYRLRLQAGVDGVMRSRGGVLERLMHVGPSPVRVWSWQTREGYVHVRAESVDPASVEHRIDVGTDQVAIAGEPELEIAVERMRFSLAVEDEMGEFYEAFKRDPLIGPTIHRKPWIRPRRRPWPWEALVLGDHRAADPGIPRRRDPAPDRSDLGAQLSASRPPAAEARSRRVALRDVPSAAVIAGRAPAELASMDLSQGRSVAMVHCAREVARGRADLSDPDADRRLLAIPEIGPWTLQCLGLHGRGDPDSLPAGDLVYVKLVGHLEGLGRRATVEEVEEYFAPYAPFRGLAGSFALVGWHKAMGAGPPARMAA